MNVTGQLLLEYAKKREEQLKLLVNLTTRMVDGDEAAAEEAKKYILIDTNLHEMIED